MSVLRTIGNVIWVILGGWITSLAFLLLGGLCCITIIGIPIGKALFQFAKLMIWPFGKVIVRETDIKGKENVSAIRRVGGVIANILWLPFGIVSFISYIFLAIGCFITIIGIPLGIVWLKTSVFVIWPIGAKVVSKDEYEAIKIGNVMRQQNNGNVQMLNGEQSTTTYSETSDAQKEKFAQGVSAVQSSVAAGAASAGAALKETGTKASAAAKQYTEQTSSYIKSVYSKNNEAAQSRDMQMSWNSIMEQTEAALFRNKYTAAVLSFLPYIVGIFTVVFVILGLIDYFALMEVVYVLYRGVAAYVLFGVLFTIRRQYLWSAICFLGSSGVMLIIAIADFVRLGVYESTVISAIMMFFLIIVSTLFGVVSLLLKQDK